MQVLELSVLTPDTDAPPPLRLMEGSVRIGRDPAMHWVLPDKAKFISRFHCEVTEAGGVFILRDESSNGLCINSNATPLGRGQTTVLKDGDTILIGHYRIAVRIQAQKTAAASLPDLPFVSPVTTPAIEGLKDFGFSSEVSIMAMPRHGTANDVAGLGVALEAAFPQNGEAQTSSGPASNLPPFLAENNEFVPARIEEEAARAMPGRIDLPDLAADNPGLPASEMTSIVASNFSAPPVISHEIPEDWDAQPVVDPASSGSAQPDTLYFAELVRIVRLLEQIELILVGDGPHNIAEIERLIRGPISANVRHDMGIHLDLFIETLRNYLSEAVRRRAEIGQGANAKLLAPEMK
jgi:type VI secretion system FHA domain protein